jgi:hypothetical protein
LASTEKTLRGDQTIAKRLGLQLIPECVDLQLPTGTCVRFCFGEPFMPSNVGPLLLTGHAVRNGANGLALAIEPRVLKAVLQSL